MKEIKEKIENWEKELMNLCIFMKEEGIDPDRLYSFIKLLLDQEKQKLIEEIRQDERSEIVTGLLREYAGQESQIIDAVNFIHKLK